MKKSPSLLITLLIAGTSLVSALLVNSSPKAALAAGEEQITQTYLYNEMVGFSSSISGNDITDNIDPNQLVDYGFRHGNVKTNEIHKFETFGDNRLGIEGTKAAFLNWKMQTCQSDGGIIKLTANKKVSVTILREKIGNDWKDDITLSIFKNSTLLEEKELKDSTTTASDFTFNTVLDEGDTLYWQIYSAANENRIIGMDASGADWSTLPKFIVTEYVEYPNTTKTIDSLANDLYNSSTAVINDSSNLFSFKGSYGDIENSLEYPASKGENKLKLGNSSLSLDGKFTLKANSNLFFTFTAKGTISIKFNWSQTVSNYEGITVKFYMDVKDKTKQAFYTNDIELPTIELLSKTFVIEDGKAVKLYIKNSGDTLVENLELLKSIYVEKLPTNTSKVSDYPIYTPSYLRNETSITHKDLAFETAKLKCEAIELKDGFLTLTTGTVNEETTDLRVFDTIRYDDGFYLYNRSVDPSFVLAGPNGTFNSDDQAVVEDYRLQTSVSEAVVYKFEASANIELKITHDATNGGWVGDGVYIEALQNNGKITKSLSKKVVNSANEAANTYSYTYHLKKGDTAYYVFGSDMALRRNLNIAPIFTTNRSNYDASQREVIFGVSLVNAYLYQTVTDTINNNYQPVTYEDTLTVTLGHGNYEEISLFKSSKGEGKGSADDALFVGTGADSDVGFQRWQFHAGLMNDNAIMKFTAEKNTKLDITHIPMVLFYNTGASIRYYIQDVDDFIEFKEERFISADTPENYYGYSVNLKAKQSLILEFSANDPEGYAVASIEWVATANTKEYDETKINDFTSSRDLQSFKDSLIREMELYVASLRKVDYTVSNYAQIEAYLEQFISEIKTLLDRDEIQALYDEIHNKIDNVLTIEEEEQLLVNAKETALSEALNYINERKHTFTKSQWNAVLEEYNTFKLLVEIETSVTNINVLLIQFKTTIDSLPATAVEENNMRTLIIGISVPASILLIAGIATPIIVINVRRLKKTSEE